MLERHATAGPQALREVSRWLGVELDGLCLFGEPPRARLALRRGPHRLVFFAGSGPLALESETPSAQKLARVLSRKLQGRTLEDMGRVVAGDPLSFVERVEPGGPVDAVRVPCIGQPMELLGAGWRNFYADQDFEVLLGVPSCTNERTVNVEYADLECFYSRPKRDHMKWTFLDWPEETMDDAPSEKGEAMMSNIVTELDERDMILGAGERADALVAEVRKSAKPGSFLLFTHLCTPIVMGEDFQGLARRCEKEVEGTAVRWSQKDRDENDNFGDYFRSKFAEPGFMAGGGDPDAVNLFHFPKRCRAELGALLEALGLTVNLWVFPEVSFPALDRLGEARWQVFCERGSYPTKLLELLEASSREVVRAPAPYGVEGTRACLKAVAEAAGKGDKFEAAWEAFFEPKRAPWESIRERARGRRLAFVASEATLPSLTALRYGQGAPVAAMARELGFGLDILYYDLHGEAPSRLPAGLEGARVATFRAPWELEKVLREGSFDAVYSDVFFDWRVSRAGKARFAGKDFDWGLAGALRAGERLLAVCGTPFYRRYAAHLRARSAA